MKKIFVIVLILFSPLIFAQEKPLKLGVFSTIDLNIGFDLPAIIKNNQAESEYEKSQLPPGKFNYGSSFMMGFHAVSWFSVSGGFRYSYIDPNYHLLYYKIQPQFYVGNPRDEDFLYLFANFGMKLNQTAAKKAGFFGIGVGKIEPLSKRFGHQFQISLDNQVTDNESNIFLGFSYGIVLFSNKNL